MNIYVSGKKIFSQCINLSVKSGYQCTKELIEMIKFIDKSLNGEDEEICDIEITFNGEDTYGDLSDNKNDFLQVMRVAYYTILNEDIEVVWLEYAFSEIDNAFNNDECWE